MDIPTIPGAVYTISTASSCDVTDKASGQLLGTAEAGSPFTTPAYSDALTLSDSSALYVQIKTFNFALAALGLLGGGESAAPDVLPAGYLSAEFLESAGRQYIYIPTLVWGTDVASWTMPPQPARNGAINMWWGVGPSSLRCRVFYHFNLKKIIIDWGTQSEVPFAEQPSGSFALEPGALTVNGVVFSITSNTFEGLEGLYLFANTIKPTIYIGYTRISTFTVSQKCDLIAALDDNGVPCMYDKATKQPFYNSGTGAFVVGMNMTQALKLSGLPATGGTLTVSLPTGYDSDPDVMTALETARSNGWTLTVQTYEAEKAAATFALRRIWVRRTQDANGAYVAQDGTRWQVDWCVAMYTPDGSTPDAHGYELFRSQDAAVEYWGLTPYVDPESENLLTETNENE